MSAQCVVKFLVCQNCFVAVNRQLNLLDVYAVCFSGQTFTQFKKVTDSMNIQFISKTLFYRYQSGLVIPSIDVLYEQTLADAKDAIINRGKLIFIFRYFIKYEMCSLRQVSIHCL